MDDYSVWTAGGTLLLVAPEVLPAQRQAIIDSLVYSQLRANKVVGSRFMNYSLWYGRYRKELSERGWMITQFFHDTRSASADSLLAPIQPVRLWLDSQYETADGIIETALSTLKGTQSNLEAFRRFTFEGTKYGTRIALEIGLVHPGPVINLCSIALHTCEPIEQVSIEGPLLARALQGDVVVKGLLAQLDDQQFEPHRAQLRVLIERKQKEQPALVNEVPGGPHE
ncbi:hypothetical protein [Pseudomonas sp. SBB6]|uniref:hypothetical protein n=1 Tax=Pseudomonas sp. SBB6 TaxID=2962032 RepID=UPI0020B68A8A|nr:hypothetical protein [Pseudomonas sp. SBB6]MCP3750348.1 hypothetical protein [Pseudomonas sp. SBB6]